jgi:hypothetical protein
VIQKFSHHPYCEGQQNADEQHACDGSIKGEVLFLNFNISGQVAKPREFVSEQPDDQTYDGDGNACNDDEFAYVIHDTQNKKLFTTYGP